jgi:oligopeptide/dipeptide ABC transporter ATP-binding protein
MRQRVMIAMAISCKPQILIADEPTTALDVTIQAQILELLKRLVDEEGMSLILITHDLGVVAGVCERTNVMYAGRFVETGPTDTIFERPRHPYTVGLLKSIPRLDASRKERLEPIKGSVKTLLEKPTSCAFAPRCAYAVDESLRSVPELREIEPGHLVACFNPVPVQDLSGIPTKRVVG